MENLNEIIVVKKWKNESASLMEGLMVFNSSFLAYNLWSLSLILKIYLQMPICYWPISDQCLIKFPWKELKNKAFKHLPKMGWITYMKAQFLIGFFLILGAHWYQDWYNCIWTLFWQFRSCLYEVRYMTT